MADLDRNISYTAIIKQVESAVVKKADFYDKASTNLLMGQIQKMCGYFSREIKDIWAEME